MSEPTFLGDYRTVVAEVVASGRRLTDQERDRYRRRGRQAAESGVPPRVVVEQYLRATRELWPSVAGADAKAAGDAVLGCVDDVVAALTEGYQLARRDLARSQDAQRREFVDDLLTGSADLGGLAVRSEAFGVDLAAPHAVVVVAAHRPFADATPLVGRVERAIAGRLADAGSLVATKDGRLVVVAAVPDEASLRFVVRRVRDVLGPQPGAGVELRHRAAVGAWQLAAGAPRTGPLGVRSSYQQARDALDLAAQVGITAEEVSPADVAVYRVVLRDRPALDELIDTILGPLAGHPDLLRTLDAYLTAGANSAAAARDLHLSVRAMTYRLRRIADLLARDPVDPAQRLTLHVAVTGARLTRWPA